MGSEKRYSLTNKCNRKYFLKVGRYEIVFDTKETKTSFDYIYIVKQDDGSKENFVETLYFDKNFINHKDFGENKLKYIMIKPIVSNIEDEVETDEDDEEEIETETEEEGEEEDA